MSQSIGKPVRADPVAPSTAAPDAAASSQDSMPAAVSAAAFGAEVALHPDGYFGPQDTSGDPPAQQPTVLASRATEAKLQAYRSLLDEADGHTPGGPTPLTQAFDTALDNLASAEDHLSAMAAGGAQSADLGELTQAQNAAVAAFHATYPVDPAYRRLIDVVMGSYVHEQQAYFDSVNGPPVPGGTGDSFANHDNVIASATQDATAELDGLTASGKLDAAATQPLRDALRQKGDPAVAVAALAALVAPKLPLR